MKVTYADLCTPDWLQRDPEVFFGFWGSCYNDYMETEPHEGYQICKQWNDTRFHGTTSATARQDGAACVAGRLQKLSLGDSTGARPVSREAAAGGVPSRTGGVGAGSVARAHLGRKMSAARVPEKACEMFVYTSNVDTAFERTGFGTEQVLEIHGNVCEWQCAKPERCRDVTWRIPDRHRFALDKRMMRAPRWTTAAPAPRIAHAQSGCTAQAPGLECCSVPSRLPMLRETTKVSEQLLQEHDSDRAASARTTHRSHAHAGGGVSNGSLSGSGIHAVRGLASNRPPSACSSCSSSSNLSGHDCLSPGSVHHGGAAAGAAPTQAATPAFSLSAYPPRAGAGPAQQPPPQRAGDVQTEQKVLNHIRCPGCGRAGVEAATPGSPRAPCLLAISSIVLANAATGRSVLVCLCCSVRVAVPARPAAPAPAPPSSPVPLCLGKVARLRGEGGAARTRGRAWRSGRRPAGARPTAACAPLAQTRRR